MQTPPPLARKIVPSYIYFVLFPLPLCQAGPPFVVRPWHGMAAVDHARLFFSFLKPGSPFLVSRLGLGAVPSRRGSLFLYPIVKIFPPSCSEARFLVSSALRRMFGLHQNDPGLDCFLVQCPQSPPVTFSAVSFEEEESRSPHHRSHSFCLTSLGMNHPTSAIFLN